MGFGIFTSVSGTAPNRIFNIEWRAQYTSREAAAAGFELRLYEGQTRFDVIYGTVSSGNTSATAGVQKNDTAFDQYFCNGSGHACYRRAKLHPDTVQSVANAYSIAQVQRQLLLRHGDSHGDGNCYSDGNCYANGNCHSHGDRYGYGYRQRLLRRRGLLHHQDLVRHRRPDRKAC